jgi:hypothetical protein
MATTILGRAKSGRGKSYEVKWDSVSKDVYVWWSGWTQVGRASGAGEAMRKVEAWLCDK